MCVNKEINNFVNTHPFKKHNIIKLKTHLINYRALKKIRRKYINKLRWNARIAILKFQVFITTHIAR